MKEAIKLKSVYRRRVFNTYVSAGFQPEPVNRAEAAKKAARHFKVRFLPFLPEKREVRILELGCGQGKFLKFLEDRGYQNIAGVDISAEQVELARALVTSCEVFQANALDYLKECRQVEVIVAIDLIEHFTKDEVMRFLKLAYDRLESEGILLLQTPNAVSPFATRIRYGDFTHEVCLSSRALANILRISGFEPMTFGECGPVIHGVKSAIRWVGWQIIRLLVMAYMLIETGTAGGKVYTQVMIAVARKPKNGNESDQKKSRGGT